MSPVFKNLIYSYFLVDRKFESTVDDNYKMFRMLFLIAGSVDVLSKGMIISLSAVKVDSFTVGIYEKSAEWYLQMYCTVEHL